MRVCFKLLALNGTTLLFSVATQLSTEALEPANSVRTYGQARMKQSVNEWNRRLPLLNLQLADVARRVLVRGYPTTDNRKIKLGTFLGSKSVLRMCTRKTLDRYTLGQEEFYIRPTDAGREKPSLIHCLEAFPGVYFLDTSPRFHFVRAFEKPFYLDSFKVYLVPSALLQDDDDDIYYTAVDKGNLTRTNSVPLLKDQYLYIREKRYEGPLPTSKYYPYRSEYDQVLLKQVDHR